MARLLVAATFLLLLLGAVGVWYTVSTDAWPWDERREPARTVWALNAKLGKFLFDHGQDTPEEIAAAPPRPVPLSAAEKAEVAKRLQSDARLKDRVVLHGGGGFVGGATGFRLKPAGGVRRG